MVCFFVFLFFFFGGGGGVGVCVCVCVCVRVFVFVFAKKIIYFLFPSFSFIVSWVKLFVRYTFVCYFQLHELIVNKLKAC